MLCERRWRRNKRSSWRYLHIYFHILYCISFCTHLTYCAYHVACLGKSVSQLFFFKFLLLIQSTLPSLPLTLLSFLFPVFLSISLFHSNRMASTYRDISVRVKEECGSEWHRIQVQYSTLQYSVALLRTVGHIALQSSVLYYYSAVSPPSSFSYPYPPPPPSTLFWPSFYFHTFTFTFLFLFPQCASSYTYTHISEINFHHEDRSQ